MPAIKLLAYYPLGGSVLDSSGNNYNGTVGGTAAYGVGYKDQAFSFNGATYISTLLNIDVSVQPQMTLGDCVRPSGFFYGQVITHGNHSLNL
ncbi:MAG: hypothetical protein HY808_14175 [Nitrospirae bacterium]|nr:hypothetical protein [Nitrospirota bacterium]